jgi:hypothetical protein
MKPTPTPFPDTAAPLDMPEISLWDHTDTAIQFWNANSMNDITTAFQGIILLGVIIFIMMALYQRANRTTENEG